ncbi:hypothetical protein ES703_20512 [subsurface metagenome]
MSDEEEREEQNILDKLNKSFTDFVENTFGESGKNFIDETAEKIKEFSNTSIKKFMEFSDDLLEKLNLNENEQVIKARDSVEDLLKQTGLLVEDEEEEF